MWTVLASVIYREQNESKTGYYYRSIQIPTFFLNENVQGIVSETQVRRIVQEIVNPLRNPDMEVIITTHKE